VSALIGWPVNLVFFGVVVLTVMRCGLLSMAMAIFVVGFLALFALGTDLSVWYAGEILFTAAVILVPALFAFRTSLAGRTLIRED
jgi:hypothetical protein